MPSPRTVRRFPPNFTDATAGTTAVNTIRIAHPVLGKHWTDMARSANWLMGRGGTLVSTAGDNVAITAGAAEVLFRFWVWPRYENASWVWFVTIQCQDTGSAYGTITHYGSPDGPSPTTSAYWRIDGSKGKPQRFDLPVTLTTNSATPQAVTFGIANNSASVSSIKVLAISCHEVPRRNLDSTYGVNISTVDKDSPIYQDATAGNDASVEGVGRIARAAKTTARKNHIFSWYNPAGVAITSGSLTALFGLDPHVCARLLESANTNRNLTFNAYAKVTGGDQTGEINVASSNAAGSGTIAVTSTTAVWHTDTTVSCNTEDPTRWATDGGIRTGTRETVAIKARKTGTTTSITVYGVCIGEAT